MRVFTWAFGVLFVLAIGVWIALFRYLKSFDIRKEQQWRSR